MAIELQEFQLILLRRPGAAPEYDEQTSARIQREHVGFYASMRQAGHVVTNGPVRDQPDERLRGIAIFAAASVDRARELANTDPAVRAGRLQVEVMTWGCPAGTMIRPGESVRLSGS